MSDHARDLDDLVFRTEREPDDLTGEDVVTACACGHAPGEHNACGECRAAVFHPAAPPTQRATLCPCRRYEP
jgi:hypothetical protein